MRYLKSFVGLLGFVFLAGCASVPQQTFHRPTEQPLKKIALITIPDPAFYHAMDWANPGLMFGAVGGAVAGAQMNAQTKQFNNLISSKGLVKATLLSGELAAKLRQYGYEVVRVDLAHKKPSELLESYDGLANDKVDAILDVVFAPYGAGYSTVNLFDREFRPDVRVKAKLVSKYSGKVLYSGVVMYGYHNPFMTATDLDAPKRYYFSDFDTLVANRDQAVEGIKAGFIAAADQIAEALK